LGLPTYFLETCKNLSVFYINILEKKVANYFYMLPVIAGKIGKTNFLIRNEIWEEAVEFSQLMQIKARLLSGEASNDN
jgi:hypothetical protein